MFNYRGLKLVQNGTSGTSCIIFESFILSAVPYFFLFFFLLPQVCNRMMLKHFDGKFTLWFQLNEKNTQCCYYTWSLQLALIIKSGNYSKPSNDVQSEETYDEIPRRSSLVWDGADLVQGSSDAAAWKQLDATRMQFLSLFSPWSLWQSKNYFLLTHQWESLEISTTVCL